MARKQIDALDQSSKVFFNSHPYRIAFEKSKKPGTLDVRVFDVADAPIEFGVVVGLIVHNLRAALDGLVCQLAIKSAAGGVVVDDICEHTQFPIHLFGQRSRHKGKFPKSTSGSIKPFRRYITRIKRFQPYKRGNGHTTTPLWRLQELNNTDKHRVVVVVTAKGTGVGLRPRMRAMHDRTRGIITGHARLIAGRMLKNGTKIAEVTGTSPDDVDVDVIIRREIGFGDSCRSVRRLPCIDVLREISDSVATVVESFASEFS